MGKRTALRKSVHDFAGTMERKLRENAHKGGWETVGVQYLLSRLCEEVAELVEEFDVERTNGSTLVGPREAFAIAAHHLRCAAEILSTKTTFLGTRGAPRRRHPHTTNGSGVEEEAADVANFAMMIAEVGGKLPVVALRERPPACGEGERDRA